MENHKDPCEAGTRGASMSPPTSQPHTASSVQKRHFLSQAVGFHRGQHLGPGVTRSSGATCRDRRVPPPRPHFAAQTPRRSGRFLPPPRAGNGGAAVLLSLQKKKNNREKKKEENPLRRPSAAESPGALPSRVGADINVLSGGPGVGVDGLLPCAALQEIEIVRRRLGAAGRGSVGQRPVEMGTDPRVDQWGGKGPTGV